MSRIEVLAIANIASNHIHDPTAADPSLLNVLQRLLGAQRPGDNAAMADLVIRCKEKDFAPSLELSAELAVDDLLVGFHRQEEVGPLLQGLP